MQFRHTLSTVVITTLLSCYMIGNAQYTHTVLPVGNFADIPSVSRTTSEIREILDDIDGNQTVLLTGDLIGQRIPISESYARIDTFLSLIDLKDSRRVIIIPGDRDWAMSGEYGWETVINLEEHINSLNLDYVSWPLPNGCPGPELISLDLGLNMIALNTQWWNHPYNRPSPESALCEIATHDEAFEELEKMLGETRFGNIVIAGHYPIRSGGQYGGHFPLSSWILPVPVVSTMVTSFKQNVGSPLYIANARFDEFADDMEDILSEYPSLVYISGHDKSREILSFEETILIQSGIPADDGFVDKTSSSIYASESAGLIALHYDMEGNAWATTYEFKKDDPTDGERFKLLQAPCMTPMRDVPVNQRMVPCLEDRYVLPGMTSKYPDSVITVAGPQYTASGFKEAILGKHYRDSWTRPVQVPYLDLDEYAGGLIPYLKGGGRQTKSLRMRAEDGKEYVFRSVDKDPSRALSYDLRSTIISIIVRDQTTTQQPYGAIPVSRMLDHTNILHVEPELFLMPNDEKLGPFRSAFGNMLGLIEERPSGRKSVTHTFADADEILSSSEMIRELIKHPVDRIETKEFLQARMFDVLVGDWSKHDDNWKWAGYDLQEGHLFRPIPRDRDHVFSLWDGALPWLVDREWAKPQGENFDYSIRGLRSLMWQARHFDRFLASEATRDDWVKAAKTISEQLPDSVIDNSIKSFPEEVIEIDGDIIAAKLKARRDDLETYADKYYSMISRSVDVCGSNQNEVFKVNRNADGTVDVSVYEINNTRETDLIYSRKFLPDETKEIRLFGLQGDDRFEIRGKARKSMLIRLVPGSGLNTIVDSSEVRRGGKATRIYSLDERTELNAGPETKRVSIPFKDAYHYRRTAFEYNTYSPLVYMFSSSGNGFAIGGGVLLTRQSYDKPDYSWKHRLMLRWSTLGNIRAEYEGKLRHVVGEWDLAYGILLDKHQRLNYFFGTGNQTTLDPELLADDYYTVRFSSLRTFIGLSRSFWDRSEVVGLFSLVGTGMESSEGNILEPGLWPDVAGNERLRLARMHLGCDLDFRDRPDLPERGMRLTVIGLGGLALNDSNVNYGSVKGTLEYFGTAGPFTLGLKVGGAFHEGNTPFFDYNYLGQNTHLRGYRQNRFTGRSLGFLNSELRIHIVDNPRAVIPFKLGLTLFYDTGKVFQVLEDAEDPGWHMGYGAGIYFVPVRERYAIQISVGFSEEESGLVRFGIGKSF